MSCKIRLTYIMKEVDGRSECGAVMLEWGEEELELEGVRRGGEGEYVYHHLPGR